MMIQPTTTPATPSLPEPRPAVRLALPADEERASPAALDQKGLTPEVNPDRLVDTFLRLVQVPGSTYNERQIADQLKRELESLQIPGLKIKEDDAGSRIGGNAGNLIVDIPGNVPDALPILFSSHMDTVRLAVGVRPQIRDGVISSDGSTALGGDNRAGCSEILEALREVVENNLPRGPIQLVFCAAEEGGLLGSEQLDPNDLHARFGFVMDVFKANEFYTQGEHLLGFPHTSSDRAPQASLSPRTQAQPDVLRGKITAEMVDKAHRTAGQAPVIPPGDVDLTPQETAIMNFAGLAMNQVGLEPTFHRLEWAGTDAISLRDKGMTAISLGAGENHPHSRQETVAVSDLVASTRVVRSIIDLASRVKDPGA